MMIANAVVGRPVASGGKIASLDPGRLDGKGKQAVELVLNGVRKTRNSLEVRVVLSSDSVKPFEAGRLYTYGEGSGDDQDHTGRFTPMKLSLDITQAARRLAGASRVDVRIHLLDKGQEADEPLFVENIELHRRDHDEP
jgi:hypothetical protein